MTLISLALERFNESTKINNSIKFSLTGGHVDWMMYTSLSLTVSIGSAMISPDGNLLKETSETSIPKALATLLAKSLLADKEKISVFSNIYNSSYYFFCLT